ncbi:MAG: MFS transporter [Woeseiaceae bacterium]|nr:MFS transporter [Woeseiaceae bacterium]NIP20041.1 MFS transporter [Woeseiaceae bacterium]NIS88837.1 MFS transporter [Woeseiaceae bacterium]
MKLREVIDRKVAAWAVYDWANSAFALSIMAVLYPLFLGSYWSAGASGAVVTARLAWITAAANFLVAVMAPILGTIADAGGYRKRFLVIFAVVGAAMTGFLGFVPEGNWPWALGLYVLASFGFYSSTVFYDSLLVDVTKPRYFDFVSALGFALGYLGGAILLAIHVWMITSPATFGLESGTEAIRAAFITVGFWWALFLAPLIKWVPEHKRELVVVGSVLRAAYRELRSTILKVGQYRNVVVFLFAYLLYVAGVFTVISMAVNYGQRLGFSANDLVIALMITNFAGFPATFAFGFIGHRYGPKTGLYIALAVYIAVSSFAVFMTNVAQYYVMAIVVGCVQGAAQGLSRSLYAKLIPSDAPGEFFGFYNLVTKVAHVLGPALVGVATLMSDEPKIVLLVVLPLFVLGGLMLGRVSGGTYREG